MNGRVMAAEMAQQPGTLRTLLARRSEIVDAVRAIIPQELAGITLVARGSSDHAAIYGRYLLEMTAQRPAALVAPSIHTLYRAPVDHHGYLAVAISQSGRTPEIVTVLGRLREQGARTVAIVNGAGTPLADVADVTIDLRVGPELAVPATKTFIGTLAVLGLVAEATGDVPWQWSDLAAIPDQIGALLADSESAAAVARSLDGGDRVLTVGRGILLVAALETALKIRETSAILAEGVSSADLRHGPIAAVGKGFPVLAFTSDGPSGADMAALVTELRMRGALVRRIGPTESAELSLPGGVPEPLLPLLATVRGQQVAAATAARRQLDPDRPEGLTKVTLTS
jgi:glucosamine--fructose-6-phosphate aminotransferase (isomerizing)